MVVTEGGPWYLGGRGMVVRREGYGSWNQKGRDMVVGSKGVQQLKGTANVLNCCICGDTHLVEKNDLLSERYENQNIGHFMLLRITQTD